MRVIVADDEEIIRTGIVELIPWDTLGYQVVGEAEDGEEALTLITEQCPEVVITDIKMPFISGLELLKRIKDIYEPLYTIMLTGYDEFKFAQEAVNNGAYAYLLKPVDPAELGRILMEIREDNEKKQAIKNLIKELKMQIAVKKVLYGISDLTEIETFLAEYGWNAASLYFNAFILEIDDHTALAQTEHIGMVKSLIYEAITGESTQIAITENKGFTYIVVAWGDNVAALKNRVSETIGKVRTLMSQKDVSLSVAIGGTYKGTRNIKRTYEEAMKALSVKFLLGKNEDICYERFIDEINQQQDAHIDIDNIAVKISFESGDAVIAAVDAIFDDIKKRGAFSYIYVQLVITNIFIYALGQLRAAEVDIEKAFGNPISKFETILSRETAKDRIDGLKELLLDIYEIIESGRANTYTAFVIKAEEYIAENFSDKGLSLGDITKQVAVSQAHFCVEFKKKTGETFIDYLTRIRMEKARDLLTLSDRKIYEISEMVGYDNATYFSTLFKKHYQMSPSEFKSMIR